MEVILLFAKVTDKFFVVVKVTLRERLLSNGVRGGVHEPS